MPAANHPIIELKNISREINKNGSSKRIIDSISYSFETGLIYNIVGPSGAGKSSLLRLLNQLDEISSGEILINGKSILSQDIIKLRRRVNLLFQTPYLFPGSVLDNLIYCCSDKRLDNSRFHLERVGLHADFSEKNIDDLSVGEKQRVALARSLILKPEVLLLDEPTSALDPSNSKMIEELIVNLAGELNLTVIIVTHNPNQALRLGGNTLLLVNGQLIESGKTQELLTNPQSEMGKKYINKELL